MASILEQLVDSAFQGDLAAVETHVAHGAEIDGQSRVWTSLHAAIESGQIEVIRFLIGAGANIEVISNGMTPLAHAVDVLIDSSVQQNRAIIDSSMSVIALLIEVGAELEPGIIVAKHYENIWVEGHLNGKKTQIEQDGLSDSNKHPV
jgi:Ankyrin repeats (3 copies)